MIKLSRLNGSELFVNPHQIEFMEEIPDTLIKMFSGKNIVVSESSEEVIKRITDYRKKIGLLGNDKLF